MEGQIQAVKIPPFSLSTHFSANKMIIGWTQAFVAGLFKLRQFLCVTKVSNFFSHHIRSFKLKMHQNQFLAGDVRQTTLGSFWHPSNWLRKETPLPIASPFDANTILLSSVPHFSMPLHPWCLDSHLIWSCPYFMALFQNNPDELVPENYQPH